MAEKHPKRPRDPNQLGKLVVDIATGEVADHRPSPGSTPGRAKGGKIGGKARADSLTPDRRKEIAQKAAAKRWKNSDNS
jgi:hypothetical protein